MDKSSSLETVVQIKGINYLLQQPGKNQLYYDEQNQNETPDEIEMMSQQSSDSRMEAMSQESIVSRMEFSSQESDTSKMELLNLSEENSVPEVEILSSPPRPDFFLTNTQKSNKGNSIPRMRKKKSDSTQQCLRECRETALILQRVALEKREKAVLAREQAVTMHESIRENDHLFKMCYKKYPKFSKL